MVRLILADDHPVVLDGVRRFFATQADLKVIATATNHGELTKALEQHVVEVIVVDLNMDGMKGAETIRELANAEGAPRVVVFSMQNEDAYAASLLRVGAVAYLNKARPPEELADAVRTVARGERYITDTLLQHQGDLAQPCAPHEELSQREREVFERLLDGQAPKQIAFDLDLSVSTVHTYTERIKEKLGVDSAQALVSYAFRHRLRR